MMKYVRHQVQPDPHRLQLHFVEYQTEMHLSGLKGKVEEALQEETAVAGMFV